MICIFLETIDEAARLETKKVTNKNFQITADNSTKYHEELMYQVRTTCSPGVVIITGTWVGHNYHNGLFCAYSTNTCMGIYLVNVDYPTLYLSTYYNNNFHAKIVTSSNA